MEKQITKTEIKNIVNDEIEKYVKKREFERVIVKICADVLDDFFVNLWQKRDFWKGLIKR